MAQPPATAGTTAVTTVGPPVLTLNPPLVENQTVVIGGMIQPGGPNAVIDLVVWDWGDGIRDTQTTLPATHSYAAAGQYTIGVEVIQSEIGAPEKRQTSTESFQVSITQVPGTYTSATTAPGETARTSSSLSPSECGVRQLEVATAANAIASANVERALLTNALVMTVFLAARTTDARTPCTARTRLRTSAPGNPLLSG